MTTRGTLDVELAIVLWSNKRLIYEVFHLCKLKNIETFASHLDYVKVVESMGLGLQVCASQLTGTFILTRCR